MIKNFFQVSKVVRTVPFNMEFQTFLDRINAANPCIQTRTDCIKKITVEDDEVEVEEQMTSTVQAGKKASLSQIYDLPSSWNKFFHCCTSNFSIMYFQGVRGLFLAVSVAIDSNLLLLSSNEQKQYIDDLCKRMRDGLSEHFEKFHYRSFGYIQSNILQILWQLDDRFQASLVHYLCDFLEVNVLLLDSQKIPFEDIVQGKYEWCAPFCPLRKTVVCHKQGFSLWGSILASDFKSHLEVDMDFLTTNFASKVPVQPVPVTMTIEEETALRKILEKMKLKDLQTKAIEYEISITDENSGKSLLKGALVERMTKELSVR
jgi:hypothetical protein